MTSLFIPNTFLFRADTALFSFGRLVVMVVAVCLLAGCSMAPKYTRPDLPVSATWPDGYLPGDTPLAAATSDSINKLGWRSFFIEPRLQKLIELALVNNRDVRIAVLNIEKARAFYQIQRADQIPSINASGQSSNQGSPAGVSSRGERMVSRQYTASLGMSGFELDFFGRIQSLKDKALEEYLATEEAMQSARISLISSVASAYLSLVSDRESLQISSDTLSSQQDSYNLIKRRHDVGVSSELDLWQAQTSVDTARVNIAQYTGQVAQDLTALSLLVGVRVTPDMLPQKALSELSPWPDIPVGLSSDVLLNRPDILQSEHMLKAANANIGAARASFFPTITLSTSIGSASRDLSGLFDAATGAWTFIPQLTLPLFDSGRHLANLRVSEAEKSIAIANYEKAIQTAFKEVSDTLLLRNTLESQLAAQQSLTHAASESYRLSRERYAQGVDNYLTVLDSQRMLFSSQLSLVSVRANRELNIINLYKSLGGGATE